MLAASSPSQLECASARWIVPEIIWLFVGFFGLLIVFVNYKRFYTYRVCIHTVQNVKTKFSQYVLLDKRGSTSLILSHRLAFLSRFSSLPRRSPSTPVSTNGVDDVLVHIVVVVFGESQIEEPIGTTSDSVAARHCGRVCVIGTGKQIAISSVYLISGAYGSGSPSQCRYYHYYPLSTWYRLDPYRWLNSPVSPPTIRLFLNFTPFNCSLRLSLSLNSNKLDLLFLTQKAFIKGHF